MTYNRKNPRATAIQLLTQLGFEMFADDLNDEGFTDEEIKEVKAELDSIIQNLK